MKAASTPGSSAKEDLGNANYNQSVGDIDFILAVQQTQRRNNNSELFVVTVAVSAAAVLFFKGKNTKKIGYLLKS